MACSIPLSRCGRWAAIPPGWLGDRGRGAGGVTPASLLRCRIRGAPMSGAAKEVRSAPLQTIWSDARVRLLVDHYRSGLSASDSATLIGGVSKNAVVSKRRRLGLFAVVGVGAEPRDSAGAGAGDRRRERAGPIRLFRGPPPLPVEPLPEMDHPPPPDAEPKPLTARRFGECAWPLGAAAAEGDHRTLFCAAPAKAGASYCPAHAARAYRRRS